VIVERNMFSRRAQDVLDVKRSWKDFRYSRIGEENASQNRCVKVASGNTKVQKFNV